MSAVRSAELQRLDETRSGALAWREWGPYLSERQWGTVREDESRDGNAWNSFPHDQARWRAYKSGEDGLAGISDDHQRLCFALALWNGKDPILKERLFGLTNGEGNHGEDVKEYYYYLDATPTSAYLKMLYKYPQNAFPYDDLLQRNRARNRQDYEYELIDTGIFDKNEYFDVSVEYAKAAPEDILISISIANRSTNTATLQVLPTLWFRNTWNGADTQENKPSCVLQQDSVVASHPQMRTYYFQCEDAPTFLFTDNETNAARLGRRDASGYFKDGINNAVVNGDMSAVNPAQRGTKVAARYRLDVGAGEVVRLRLRLSTTVHEVAFGPAFDAICTRRRTEADEFYHERLPQSLNADQREIVRQALAGMLWTKQYYEYEVAPWLTQHGVNPLSSEPGGAGVRNRPWFHMRNHDIISMPDKWEYPWYAAWDLGFHAIPLAMVDPDFAKQQLELMLAERYQHPNGQLPAYEWNFSDVNPPVHAWATFLVYSQEKAQRGVGDIDFLDRIFRKLLLNFTWWVNRKDPRGQNVFEGGFLGLDNIGVFDRSAPLPTGGYLEQADGTAWMAFYCQTMLQIALELARERPSYEDMIPKFVEHFLWIAAAMDRIGECDNELWDEQDGFFYDVLRLPDGRAQRLRVRSIVGLLPLCATAIISPDGLHQFPGAVARIRQFRDQYPQTCENIAPLDRAGVGGRRLIAVLNEDKLRRVLSKMLDENEFLSAYGIRSLSKYHSDHPFVMHVGHAEYRVQYEPAESTSPTFGGNSNWRGPVWMPINVLIVRALLLFYVYYGDEFQVECPTGSGKHMTLLQVAQEISHRLSSIFERDAGRRPVFGANPTFQNDPQWRDHLLFYEYFHGDNGAGLGASHQTGWTGIVGRLIQLYGAMDGRRLLETGLRPPRPAAA